MKRLHHKNINNPDYWDLHQTATDRGLRQYRYLELAGTGKRIIEIGCGSSPFVDMALSNFKESWGLDYSPATIIGNRLRFPKVNYVLSEATNTPFKDKFFDVSVSGEMIEHLENPEDLIKEMARITKKMIIISTPHVEIDEPEHIWEFEEEDLLGLLEPYGKAEVETIHSDRFKGRSYIFGTCELYE